MQGNPDDKRDMYGQVHPDETPELISSSLSKLEVELSQLPSDNKKAWEQAKERCPDLVDDKHKLMFLRCEVFAVDLAARRLVGYWDRRLELFGPEKAFLPLTLDGTLEDDSIALKRAFIQSTERIDESGRRIIFVDPSRLDKTKYKRESMVRTAWYMVHAVLEDETTQKKGVVFLACPRRAKMSNVDRKLMAMNVASIRGCLPLRLSALHICHPPTFFGILFPLIRLLLGARLRERIRVHTGSDEKVLASLNEFGIAKDSVPNELGGNIVLDHARWLEDRKAVGL